VTSSNCLATIKHVPLRQRCNHDDAYRSFVADRMNPHQQCIEIVIDNDSDLTGPVPINGAPAICLVDSAASLPPSYSSSDESTQYSSDLRWDGDFETGGWVNVVTIDDDSDDECLFLYR
jgi:hypothetical protein